MIAKELITNDIEPVKTSDSAVMAMGLMDEYRVSHLPIVNNEEFLGLISETDILNLNEPDEPLGNHKLSLKQPYVTEDKHIYDVVKQVAEEKLTLIPVLDDKRRYLGSITLQNLAQQFAKLVAVEDPGGIFVLEVNQNDYTLTEIARIIEENDAKILSLYVTSKKNSTKMEITIKINKMDIAPIAQTFNRYNYIITQSYAERSDQDDIKERFDAFMNYLNI